MPKSGFDGCDDGPFLQALDALVVALDDLVVLRRTVQRRAQRIRREMLDGKPLREVVQGEEKPMIVQTMREASASLTDAFSRLQRTQAQTLHCQGLSMEKIASMFGITRQRVAHLVRDI